MKRIPIIPTIIVAAAIATMIGLGIWQLNRLAWKERLIAEMGADNAYVPATVTCTVDGVPEVRVGRSESGEVGYRYLARCGEMQIDLGWSRQPDLQPRVAGTARFTGKHLARGEQARVLILDTPTPPLARSELPRAEEIPNNHLAYAGQWFFFAAAAAVIYALALRRRTRAA